MASAATRSISSLRADAILDCGGVMHYGGQDGNSSAELVPGCKLCKNAVMHLNTSTAHEPMCKTTVKVNPGCPTDGFMLYARVDQHSFVDVDNVSCIATGRSREFMRSLAPLMCVLSAVGEHWRFC